MAESKTPDQEWVLVARLGKTRGLRGEILGRSWNPAGRLLAFRRVRLRRPGGDLIAGGQEFEIEDVRPYQDGLMFRFRGIESIDAAKPMELCEVVVAESQRPPLPDGEFYLSDLVGCRVYERATGREVGRVTGWQEFGGPELLEVAPAGREFGDVVWIPLVRSICVEIDPAGRRIVVDPPEGLLELNEGGAAG